jgi:solute carrier family 25 S-adenosylmethionine transporter 26
VASLYRGVFGAASGAGIAIGAYFAVYGVACNMLSAHSELAPTAVAFVAGGIAAAGSSFVKVPLAVCIRSVQAGVYPNAFAAATSIVKAAGPRGLFTGYLPTVLEDVPDMAIKFAAYESMRQLHSRFHKGRPASPQEDFAMGATAGAMAAAFTTPLDVIKTNMMCSAASRPSMVSAATAVLAQGGPSALFRGVGARALSNGINSAVFFCFFEAMRTAIKQNALRQQQLAAGGSGSSGGVASAAAGAGTAAGAALKPALAVPLAPRTVRVQYASQQQQQKGQQQAAMACLSLALALRAPRLRPYGAGAQ